MNSAAKLRPVRAQMIILPKIVDVQETLNIFLRRYFAWMIDAAFILALGLIISLSVKREWIQASDLLSIIWAVYGTLLEASSWQGTIGKRLMRLKVMTNNGHRISIYRSLVRNSFRILPELLMFSILWVFFTTGRQAMHDKFTGTFVE
jgi:uncharacterized RDD family membrane protein YckC